jgi:hypothetical protein
MIIQAPPAGVGSPAEGCKLSLMLNTAARAAVRASIQCGAVVGHQDPDREGPDSQGKMQDTLCACAIQKPDSSQPQRCLFV